MPRQPPLAFLVALLLASTRLVNARTTLAVVLNSTSSPSTAPASSTAAEGEGASAVSDGRILLAIPTLSGTTEATSTAGGLEAELAASVTLGLAAIGGLAAETVPAKAGKVLAVETSTTPSSSTKTTSSAPRTTSVARTTSSVDFSSSTTRTRSSSTRSSLVSANSTLSSPPRLSTSRNATSTRRTSTSTRASVASAVTTSRLSTSRSASATRDATSTRRTASVTHSATTDSVEMTGELESMHVVPSSTTARAVKTGSGAKTTSKTKKKTKTSTTSYGEASPTAYGYAKVKSGCTSPPSTFAGTNAGFASLCSVRYCDAKKVTNLVWSGNDGEVTRQEIEGALGMLANVPPLWANGNGNYLSDGALGQAAYNAGLLFEITGDIRALDAAVRIADNILALQNQNSPDPVVIWTGEVDPVWPTKDLHPTDGKLVYAGCENGLIVGNMVAAAVMILKNPCLWEMVPPTFDGPTVFNDSVTYFERAKAYIAAGDDTYENYFFRFLDRSLSIIQPADERWSLVGDTRKAGTPMPWNRRMMMVHGYLRLAAAHETAAAYDVNLTTYYDRIVQQNVADFLGDLNETKAVRNGVTTFDWDYSFGEDNTEESQGVHAYFDIWGSWIAWQRNSATFGLSNQIGVTFANTFQNTISFGNGSFSGLVTGSSTKKAYSISTLWGGWSFYALWLPEWYETLATANVQAGFNGRSWFAIPLLWTKHCRYSDDYTKWTGLFSSGYGVVASTSSTSSSSDTSGAASLPLHDATALLGTLIVALLLA